MRFPDLLIIGAMKSGTTSLYGDLSASGQVYFPLDKEPNALSFDKVLSSRGKAEYASLFRDASKEQLIAEASTMYTMSPLFNGAPQRAKKICGADLRLIYIVRDPIHRIFSHYFHWKESGRTKCSFDEAVIHDPHFIAFSSYNRQLNLWLEEFNHESLLVVSLNDYSQKKNRKELADFVGVSMPDETQELNTNSTPRRLSTVGSIASNNRIYRNLIRRYLPNGLKEAAKKVLSRQPHQHQITASRDTLNYLIDTLAPECEALSNTFKIKIQLDTPDRYLELLDRKYSGSKSNA